MAKTVREREALQTHKPSKQKGPENFEQKQNQTIRSQNRELITVVKVRVADVSTSGRVRGAEIRETLDFGMFTFLHPR